MALTAGLTQLGKVDVADWSGAVELGSAAPAPAFAVGVFVVARYLSQRPPVGAGAALVGEAVLYLSHLLIAPAASRREWRPSLRLRGSSNARRADQPCRSCGHADQGRGCLRRGDS